MKKCRKLFRYFVGVFLALILSGCALAPILIPAGVAGIQNMLSDSGTGKTFSEVELQRAIPALIGFKQTTVLASDGIYDWTGIWMPKDIDIVKGGEYTILVIMSGSATRQDFFQAREKILSLYHGIKIIKTDELSTTAYYPRESPSLFSPHYQLNGQSVQGDVYTVAIPPQAPKVIEPVKSSKKRKH
ncbi:hypothetical protein D4R99_01075 [bacterium]|nr:MAG: hypothetical protein D4R99_01075 [bacterium]